jgi:hypothetical protein
MAWLCDDWIRTRRTVRVLAWEKRMEGHTTNNSDSGVQSRCGTVGRWAGESCLGCGNLYVEIISCDKSSLVIAHLHLSLQHAFHTLLFVLLFFFCSIWVWTQALVLANQVLYHLSHSVSIEYLSWDRVLLYAQAGLDSILLFVLPHVHEMTGTPLCPAIGWNGVSWTIFSGWLQTTILPISASQVAMITGGSQCTQLHYFFLILKLIIIVSPY